VIRHSLTRFGSDQLGAFLYSSNNPLGGQLKVNDRDELFVVSCCDDSCLIANVFDVCATEAWSECGQSLSIVFNVNVAVKHQGLEVNLEDLASSLEIG
jgi:hypothetical protein